MRAAHARTAALALVLALAAPPAALAEDYGLTGREVAGAASLAEAPAVEPGLIRDALPASSDGEVARIYRVDVPEGARLHASATAVPPGPDLDGEDYTYLDLDVRLVDADGESCVAEYEGSIGEESSGRTPILAYASSTPTGLEDGCAAGPMFVEVARSGAMHRDTAVPVEVRIAVEPAEDGAEHPPAASTPLTDTGPQPGAPDAEGLSSTGSSYGLATPLAPGSYRVRLSPDEPRYVSVDVAEGQRLRWRAEVVSAEHADTSRSLEILAWNPVRMPVPLAEESDTSTAASPGSVLGAGYASAVSIANRESEDSDVAGVWMPGRQVLSLTQHAPLEVDEATGAQIEPVGDVDVILTIEVEGEAVGESADRTLTGAISALPWGRILAAAGALVTALLGIGLLLGAVRSRRRS